VVILKIEGKKVTRLDEVEMRGRPEAVAWSADGTDLYVGSYMDSDGSILKGKDTKNGLRVVNTGTSLKLPGPPASMRARHQERPRAALTTGRRSRGRRPATTSARSPLVWNTP